MQLVVANTEHWKPPNQAYDFSSDPVPMKHFIQCQKLYPDLILKCMVVAPLQLLLWSYGTTFL